MDGGGFRLGGSSPFLTERARQRAPQVVEYAALPGAAFLVSPGGQVVLRSGSIEDVDEARIARVVGARARHREVQSFRVGGTCVHVAPVTSGWVLCVMSTTGADPALTLDRTRRAGAVLAMALVDGTAPRGNGGAAPSGAPAEVFVQVPRRRLS